jgi:hypothetical protein
MDPGIPPPPPASSHWGWEDPAGDRTFQPGPRRTAQNPVTQDWAWASPATQPDRAQEATRHLTALRAAAQDWTWATPEPQTARHHGADGWATAGTAAPYLPQEVSAWSGPATGQGAANPTVQEETTPMQAIMDRAILEPEPQPAEGVLQDIGPTQAQTWGAVLGELLRQPWQHNHSREPDLPVSYRIINQISQDSATGSFERHEACDGWKPVFNILLPDPMTMGAERSTAEARLHQEQIEVCRIFATNEAADELATTVTPAGHRGAGTVAVPIDLVWNEGTIDRLFIYMRAEKEPERLAEGASRLREAKEGRSLNVRSIEQILDELTPPGNDAYPDFPLAWHGRDKERWAVLRPIGTAGLHFMGTRTTWNEVQRTHDFHIIRGPGEGGRRNVKANIAVANSMLVPWMAADEPTDMGEVSALAEARRDFRRRF